jgi:hypothetical protein
MSSSSPSPSSPLPEFLHNPSITGTPVTVTQLTVECPSCHQGQLTFTGRSRQFGSNKTETTRYQHQCSHCGVGTFMSKQYPHVTYTPGPSVAVTPAEEPLPWSTPVDDSSGTSV